MLLFYFSEHFYFSENSKRSPFESTLYYVNGLSNVTDGKSNRRVVYI